jgi:acyl-CoA reductase-like NAD-dependent aldehyde dehydrogenase
VFIARAIIGNGQGEAFGERMYDRRNIVSGAIVTRAVALDRRSAETAADAAARAFSSWSTMAPASRAALLRRGAEKLVEITDELCTVGAAEVGATPDWVRFQIKISVDTLLQAAGLAHAIGESDMGQGPSGAAYRLLRKPVGVVLGIAPWNAAVTLAVRAVAAPLALGNTVVLKGSELCPKLHELVVQALIDAGLPGGVLNYVSNAPEDAHDVVEALIAHPAVRRVNFTGSTRVGREIAVMAAQNLKRCLLELSGKATAIVLADADIEAAAHAVAHGAFINQGQVCMSTDRVVVDQAVADQFVARLASMARAFRTDLASGLHPLGQLIGTDAVLRVRGLIDDALAKGAVLVEGGDAHGAILQPTVLDRVAYGMRIYGEEVFGPAVGIIRVADAEEALTVANDTDYGLAASVFSQDLDRARDIARRIECGAVHVNGTTVCDDPAMPYGGVKASGYGRFGGQAVIDEFTELQWMTLRDSPAVAPPGSSAEDQ